MNLRDATRGEAGALRPAQGARRAFACRLPRDAHTAAVLRFLDAAGEACLDHVAETEDGYLATPTVAEIERIERHGIVVERGRELAGASRSQGCVPLELSHQRGHELRAQFAPQALPKGIHNVRVRIEGRLPGNAPFTRTVLRTIER